MGIPEMIIHRAENNRMSTRTVGIETDQLIVFGSSGTLSPGSIKGEQVNLS
ncbi:MAG: hypothetical protein ACYDH1_04790 [Anaerolineaceae bacterium]|jgi:hypothetical protein